MPLTDRAIASAKPKAKPYKLHDERGLYMIVTPTGGRWWRFRFSHAGREQLLSLGVYPDTSLRRAREKRDEARRLVADGVNPSAARKAERAKAEHDFESVARQVLAKDQKSKAASTYEKKLAWCTSHVFPFVGRKPIGQITAQDLRPLLRRIETRGNHETAHRVRAFIARVFKFAVVEGMTDRNPAADLQGSLEAVVTRNRSAITAPARFTELLRAIDLYTGQPATQAALRMMPLTFVRSIELRGALWGEFTLDDDEPLWRIPGSRMKMGIEHLVPLSTQVVEILRALRPLTDRGDDSLTFPSLRAGRPLSENTLLLAVRQLGFAADEMSVHGFRASANSLLVESGFPPELVDLQLAHKPKNKVEGAYNRATRMAERRRMMQSWSDYLDGLKRGADVVPIKRGKAS